MFCLHLNHIICILNFNMRSILNKFLIQNSWQKVSSLSGGNRIWCFCQNEKKTKQCHPLSLSLLYVFVMSQHMYKRDGPCGFFYHLPSFPCQASPSVSTTKARNMSNHGNWEREGLFAAHPTNFPMISLDYNFYF